jgi:hypothetical protein
VKEGATDVVDPLVFIDISEFIESYLDAPPRRSVRVGQQRCIPASFRV